MNKRFVGILVVMVLLISTLSGLSVFGASGAVPDYAASTYDGKVCYLDTGIYYFELKLYEGGSYGDLYAAGELIDSAVDWNFHSNGVYVYYSKQDGVYRVNLEGGEKEFLVADEYSFIDGIYKDKYLYYSSIKTMDETGTISDSIIFDLEARAEISRIENVGSLEVTAEKIYTVPCSGDMSPLSLTERNIDGTEPVVIAENVLGFKSINNCIYYAEVDMSEGYQNMKSRIVRYSPAYKKSDVMTDYHYGYAEMINGDNAVIVNLNTEEKVTVYYNKEVKVTVDGEEVEFDQFPMIVDGRTLVPVRAVIEKMGGKVKWYEESQTVQLRLGKDTILLMIGNEIATLNGENHTLDVPPQIINSRTLLPIRFIAEGFNFDVEWIEETQTVVITSPPEVPMPEDYTGFVGLWHKIDPDGLNGDVYLDITSVNGNEIVFAIDGEEPKVYTIENNQVKWEEEWVEGPMGLTLTFYGDYLHLEYSRTAIEWYDEIIFVERDAPPNAVLK